MSTHNIKIENCNTIESAEISLATGALNIKYGPNGLGKSTIAKAILAAVLNDGSLRHLKPFKYRSLVNEHEPRVTGTEGIKSVLIFDEFYVSQFVFKEDEVLKNSFDIFIKTHAYMLAMQDIEKSLNGIKSAFNDNDELSQTISDLKTLRDAFGWTKAGELTKSTRVYKAIGSGNPIENIPEQLLPYSDFIKSKEPAAWIAWQAKGNAFLQLSENCPYCSSNLQEPSKKEVIKLVAEKYDSKSVEHLNILQGVIHSLGKYFVESCKEKLDEITKGKTELSKEANNFLKGLHADAETLITKLEGLKNISFFSLRDVDKIEEEVGKLKIDLSLLSRFNSTTTQAVVNPTNAKLNELAEQIGGLKEKIQHQKGQIEKSILANQTGINDFLKLAGYKYEVRVTAELDSYKMKLVHIDLDEHIKTASQHLSYGEKNAFALVLFMYQVLKQMPDLVILDDPVSSFDKTKKFAILNELFGAEVSLKNTTVLMLTHDIEPAIDVIMSVRKLFKDSKPKAYFLSSKAGVAKEARIKYDDIQTFAQICAENIQNLNDEVIKCIYARRHFEILNDRNMEYNYLANLLHARQVPIIKQLNQDIEMSTVQIEQAILGIKKVFSDFDYAAIFAIIQDKEAMKNRFYSADSGYEKLQLFRIYRDAHAGGLGELDAILRKFANESCHIENEYIMQLNPHKFDNVPEYIIQECNKVMSMS